MSGRAFHAELLQAVPLEHRRALVAVLRRWHGWTLYLPAPADARLDAAAVALVNAGTPTADAARALQTRYGVARSTAYAALQRARLAVR